MQGNVEFKNTTLAEFIKNRAGFDEKPTLCAYGFVPIDKPILTALYGGEPDCEAGKTAHYCVSDPHFTLRSIRCKTFFILIIAGFGEHVREA